MAAIRFRGALGAHVVLAVTAGVVAGGSAAFAGLELPARLPSPFWSIGFAVGGLVFLLRYLTVYAPSGVIVDDIGIAAARAPADRIAFAAIERLRLATLEVPTPGGQKVFVRHLVVEGAGRELKIAELRHVPAAGPVIDVADSALLLALLAERTGTPGLLPEPEAAPLEQAAAPPATTPAAALLQRGWGVLALLLKVGGKLITLVAALFKFVKTGAVMVKPGWAAISLAAYSIVFDWRFGLLLLFMIFWHEYGHVHAMRRVGIPVKGIYFIPLLGGAAVHEAPVTRRWHQVYVDLNGPLWGGALAVAALLVFYGTGGDQPFWAALASWWALINLFNLLPVLPLDGGRTLSAIAFSIGSPHAGLLVLAGLLVGAGLAIAFQLDLLALMAVIGAMEFGGELAAARWRVALRALDRPERIDFATWRKLAGYTRTVGKGDDTPRVIGQERALYERRRAIALGTPMTRRQLAVAIAAYTALVAALIATMMLVRHVPGADISALFLRG